MEFIVLILIGLLSSILGSLVGIGGGVSGKQIAGNTLGGGSGRRGTGGYGG